MKTENGKLNIIRVEASGFQDLCNRLNELEEENQSLRLENDFLQKELSDIKEMSMFEFGNTYCSSESLEADGHALARSLGVGQ